MAFGDGQRNDSLDPALQFTGVGGVAGGMVYDTLLHAKSNWELTPQLAEDWSVNDAATRYTFKLRPDVRFHDGSKFTARDVEAHFKRILDESVGSGGLAEFASVLEPSGIKVPDPTTVIFELTAPDAFFGVRVANRYGHIPKAGTTEWINGSNGTGPFISKSFKPGVGFEFERNPDYWQEGVPYLDAVDMVVVPEQSTRVEGLLSGDIDITDPPPFTALARLESDPNIGLAQAVNGTPYMYDIDGSILPFSNADVKKALKMGIDRQQAVDIITLGNGIVSADSFVTPGDPYYPEDLEPPPYDPEQGTSLLEEAGYGASSPIQEEVWTTKAYPYLDEGAAFIKEQFAEMGVEIEIRSVSNDQYLKAFLNRPMVMDYATPLHPAQAFDTFCRSDGGANVSRIDDPQIDKWIDEFKSTIDFDRQKELSDEIIRRFSVESAEIIPFHFFRPYPHKTRVNGLEESPTSLLEMRQAWLSS